MDSRAQGTVVAALIFFTIMIVVSAGLFVYSNANYDVEKERFEDLDSYVMDFGGAFMGATLPNVTALDGNGNPDHRPPGIIRVEELLLEELALLDRGLDRGLFYDDVEPKIAGVGTSILKTGYHYTLAVEYYNESAATSGIYLSDQASGIDTSIELDSILTTGDIVYSSWERSMTPFDLEGGASFELAMWSD